MPTENIPLIQDENAIHQNVRLTRSKTSTVHDNQQSNTANTKEPSNIQRRPALSNLTNTSSQTAITKNLKSKQQQQQITTIKEDKRLPLKRPATESSSTLADQARSSAPDLKKPRIDYEWEDLDAEDSDDPLMVSEYVNEIFDYLHELELKTLPDSTYLSWQKNLKPKMRSILVDWIVEVHLRFRLLPETLFLAINLMDRFMSKETIQVDKLQLLATGSLFIAAKYEEVYSPSVKNYSYVTDGGYTEEEILEAEKFILSALDFDLSYPNPMNFLRRISKADEYDIQTRTIGKYLLEISIMDHRFIGLKPSLCAAAAMYVSRKMLGRSDWNGTLVHYSGGYKKNDFKHVVELLLDYLTQPVIHEEFFKKYASKKFMKSSILARQWAKKIEAECIDIMEDNDDSNSSNNNNDDDQE